MAEKKNKGGRPRSVIDQEQFEELCHIQCTQEEICAVLKVDHKTLDKWCAETYEASFSQVFDQKREGGKCSLRRSQWLMSKTNPTMAIWLGKQYLGQRDKKEEDNSLEKVLQNMTTLAEVLTKTNTQRKIEDLE